MGIERLCDPGIVVDRMQDGAQSGLALSLPGCAGLRARVFVVFVPNTGDPQSNDRQLSVHAHS